MHPPHGPIKITANRQVTLPADVLRQLDLAPGDSVYVAVAESPKGSLTVMPVELVVQWMSAGRREPHGDGDQVDSGPNPDDGSSR